MSPLTLSVADHVLIGVPDALVRRATCVIPAPLCCQEADLRVCLRGVFPDAAAGCSVGFADRKRATPTSPVGSRVESIPAGHLDRVWPDTGPTAVV